MPGRTLTQAASRRSTRARPDRSASTTEAQVVYTSTARSIAFGSLMSRFHTIAFVAGQTPEAREAYGRLSADYGNAAPEKADVIVALGGDGLMLQALHKFMTSGKPIYGMHRGTVGFLMNDYARENLRARLDAAKETVIHPLLMRATGAGGKVLEHRAINEVSLFRQSAQAAHLRV